MANDIGNPKLFKDTYTRITVGSEQKRQPKNHASTYIFVFLLMVVILAIIFKRFQCNTITTELGSQCNSKPKYWVHGKTGVDNRNGVLHNLHTVLEILGYEKSNNETPWNLLWAHANPFKVLNLNKLKPHQKVNHFPGIGYIAYKADLVTSGLKSTPKAFRLPNNKKQFLKYASENKNAIFVVKSNHHGHVMLKNASEIDLDNDKSFVQEFIQNPLLVDGYKFDIGVYVVITSVDPLRVYAYKGDVAFRYCLEPYYPFDPTNLKKYVISEYRPTWNVPALARLYKDLGFSHKDTFETYIRSKGIDLSMIWRNVDIVLTELFITQEKYLVKSLEMYESKENFFEFLRVDMIVDEDLKVHLMEANLCPNLSSRNFPINRLLFEQILYNLFNLVGVASQLDGYHPRDCSKKEKATHMISADNSIAVWSAMCNGSCAAAACTGACALCRGCLAPGLRRSLLRAHTEHLHRGNFRRLVPPPMTPNTSPDDQNLQDLSPMNKLQYLWYQGKCNIDAAWCS